MKMNEQKFMKIIRSNNMRAYYAAHRMLDDISTPVLLQTGIELLGRARYLYLVDTPEKADYANQFAGQIIAVLRSRNVPVTELAEKMDENMMMF
jgi:hypothetical protein